MRRMLKFRCVGPRSCISLHLRMKTMSKFAKIFALSALLVGFTVACSNKNADDATDQVEPAEQQELVDDAAVDAEEAQDDADAAKADADEAEEAADEAEEAADDAQDEADDAEDAADDADEQ